MRWLTKYPITYDEVLNCLKQFQKECNPEAIGDMRPLLLEVAINVFKMHKFMDLSDLNDYLDAVPA